MLLVFSDGHHKNDSVNFSWLGICVCSDMQVLELLTLQEALSDVESIILRAEPTYSLINIFQLSSTFPPKGHVDFPRSFLPPVQSTLQNLSKL